jgi:hypothetical protein
VASPAGNPFHLAGLPHGRERRRAAGTAAPLTWPSAGFGMALVSDIGWDDLRQLEARLGSASGEKE